MLRREVRLRYPIGSSGKRRWIVYLTSSSLVIAYMFVSVVAPRVMTMYGCGESKEDIARLDSKRYVDEAYPLWRRQNPDRTCPRTLAELNEFTNRGKSIADPWGNHYSMSCEDGKAYVSSAGEDATFETPDDLRSWE